MAEMSSNNPYAPPAARVQDIHDDTHTQPIKLWSAQGRMGRLRWLAWSVIGSLAIMPVAFVGGLLGAASGSEAVLYLVLGVAYIAYAVFYALLTIQRCHDLDWSGWVSLIVLIPLVALVFLFMRGSPGSNRFGAPPPPNPRGMAGSWRFRSCSSSPASWRLSPSRRTATTPSAPAPCRPAERQGAARARGA